MNSIPASQADKSSFHMTDPTYSCVLDAFDIAKAAPLDNVALEELISSIRRLRTQLGDTPRIRAETQEAIDQIAGATEDRASARRLRRIAVAEQVVRFRLPQLLCHLEQGRDSATIARPSRMG